MSTPSPSPSDFTAHADAGEASVDPTCPRHRNTVTYVSCQRCRQPVCTQCQRPASVGVQCVDCVKAEQRADGRARPLRSGLGFTAQDGPPLVTYAIIAVCVLVWIGQRLSPSFYNDVAFIPIVGKSEPWRFITSGFAHDTSSAIPFHLLFNMYALYIVGQYLEPLLGRVRFAALYLLSVLGGSVGYQLLTSPPVRGESVYSAGWAMPLVGASGGVFGLFIAVVVFNRHLGRDISAMMSLLALNVVIGFFVANVAWQAHLGGAVVGGLVSLALYAVRRKSDWVQYGLCAAFAVGLFALAYVRYSMTDLSYLQIIT